MSNYEEQAGELLYKYIAELKRTEGVEGVNFIACTPVDPAEITAMLPLADALHETLQQPMEVSSGMIDGRAKLMAAIQADRRPVRRKETPVSSGRVPFSVFTRRGTMALITALLILIMAVAIAWTSALYFANRSSCSPSGTLKQQIPPPPPATGHTQSSSVVSPAASCPLQQSKSRG